MKYNVYGSTDGLEANYDVRRQSEDDHLLEEAPTPQFPSKGLRYQHLALVLMMIAILAVASSVGLSATYPKIGSSSTSMYTVPQGTKSAFDMDAVTLTAENEYGIFNAPYPWLENGVLVEPFKQTTLTISNVPVPEKFSVQWKIRGDQTSTTHSTSSPSLQITLKRTGTYSLTMSIMDGDDVLGTLSKNIYVKYVKRELRSLTDSDRAKFLDAAHVMWTTSTEDGKQLYGDAYTSIHNFVIEHSIASNNIDCDAYHDGSGFFTHHFALTNSFDASLRAINPEVTLHYWDFTIEGQAIKDAGEIPSYLLQVSPIFTDEWFGSVDENYHIADSRWKHSRMTAKSDAARGNKIVPNSFSMIRSYWNNNNDKEVVRRMFDVCGFEATNKAIPACSSHYSLLNSDTLATFQVLSPGVGHGPMHVHIGGMGGECETAIKSFMERWKDVLEPEITTEEIINLGLNSTIAEFGEHATRMDVFRARITGEYFHFYRAFWRSHICARDNTAQLLKCPESCDDTMAVEDCKCEIPDLSDDFDTIENVYYCIVDEASRETFSKLFSQDFITDMVKMIATSSLYEGEMIESASPIDITFWVIHPTLERLLMAKRLPSVVSMASSPVSKWPSVDGSDETWLEYSYYSYPANTKIKYKPEGFTCRGHAADDAVLPHHLPMIDGFANYADTDHDKKVSNWEYFMASNPNDPNGLDYVYDSFTWSHCDSAL